MQNQTLLRVALTAVTLVLLGACSPQDAAPPADAVVAPPASGGPEAASQAADPGPPTVNGLYIAKDACPGEGCYLTGRIRAYEPADLYDKAGAGAVITGKIAAGEWVEIVTAEDHVRPLRGVVREGRKHFATGEVVYLLSSQGEGCHDVWSKGAIGSWCDPNAVGDPEQDEVIDLDVPPGPRAEGAALWVKVKTGNGAEGWLREVGAFACTGFQDRDADCPPLPR